MTLLKIRKIDTDSQEFRKEIFPVLVSLLHKFDNECSEYDPYVKIRGFLIREISQDFFSESDVWIAGDDVIGFIIGEPVRRGFGKVYGIEFLYVRPECRRLGTGKALLETVKTHAKMDGYTHVDVCCLTGNMNAKRMYMNEGFRTYTESMLVEV